MYRKITINNTEHTANLNDVGENYRITITGGQVTVSADMVGPRTESAEFEALFWGRQRVEVLTAPVSENMHNGMPISNYDIGPVVMAAGDKLRVAKKNKLAELALARWEAETGGVTLNGIKVRTDRESQAMITAAALQATIDPNYTCNWKAENGFITLDATQIMGIAMAVRAHVQGCFDNERTKAEIVEAAVTVNDVSAVVWGAGS